MRLSVKTTLQDSSARNEALIREFEQEFPYVYRNKYFANARMISPEVTGNLKNSIGSQILGNKLTIVWRAPYAAAVNEGGHTDKSTHFAPAKGYGNRERGYRTRAGWHHPYRTGSKGFVNRIGVKTFTEMEDYIRNKMGKK